MQETRRPDGSWVTIPVAIVNRAEDGPRLWLQAGCQGGEAAGAFCVTEIVNVLDPSKLRGAVIGIPVVNTPALKSLIRLFAL
jgi:predicted deacylase